MLDKRVKEILASYLSAKEELGKIAPIFNWSNLLGDYGEYIAINEFDLTTKAILNFTNSDHDKYLKNRDVIPSFNNRNKIKFFDCKYKKEFNFIFKKYFKNFNYDDL